VVDGWSMAGADLLLGRRSVGVIKRCHGRCVCVVRCQVSVYGFRDGREQAIMTYVFFVPVCRTGRTQTSHHVHEHVLMDTVSTVQVQYRESIVRG
jgi:hypothetical protein